MISDAQGIKKTHLLGLLLLISGIGLLLIGITGISYAQEDESDDIGAEEDFDDEAEIKVEPTDDEAVSASETTAANENEYIGVGDCGDCHRGLTESHQESRHTQTLRATDKATILADFEQGQEVRTVQFPGEDAPRPFMLEDVAFALGSGRHVQRYLYEQAENQYYVFPAEWNVATQAWQPYTPSETWLDPAYDFGQNCAGCHTTGLDVENITWEDDGVQCEACHGPGGNHADTADEAGSRPNEEEMAAVRDAIVLSPDPQICGQCHSQGTSGDHPFSTEYVPGENLLDSFTLAAPDDAAHWWSTGHAAQPNMQFNEWFNSGHANALTSLQGSPDAQDACLECHSTDYQFTENIRANTEREGTPPDPMTVANAQFGVTCVACHSPHLETDYMLVDAPVALCTDCHRDTEITASVHHPVQELYEGLPLVENVAGIPSSHFSAEEPADCLTCHMPEIAVGGEARRFSHALAPALPTTAEHSPESTCTTCHSDLSTEYMENFVQETQAGIVERLSAIDTAQENAASLPGWVLLAAEAVEGDGSLGLHNYAYTDALLDAVEVELDLVSINDPAVTAVIEVADPASCEECHRDEYRQWQTSPHALASLNDPFLQEYAAQGRPDFCKNCHASGYDITTQTAQHEGVVCSTCHAPESAGEHPPAPLKVDEQSVVCGQCHSGAHAPTYDEWLVSDHRAAGIDCVDCHTPHDNGLLLETVNATCGDCHQEALVDDIHMGEDMTCTDCHMNRRTTEGGVHVIATGHTMSIDPGVCSECHGNTHLLSVRDHNRSDEEISELQTLEEEVALLRDESDRNLNSGVVGGALGMVLVGAVLYIILRLRKLL